MVGTESDAASQQPVLVWGAGAIGGTIGAHLARAGHEVTFVDTDAAHVAAIADPARGLTLEGPVAQFSITAPAFTPATLQGQWRRVLLAVKAQHTTAACEAMLPHLTEDAAVLSLQNGLTETFMMPVLGRQRCMGGFVLCGCDWLAPGRIMFGNPGQLAIGEFGGGRTDRLVQFWQMLRAFNPGVDGVPDIEAWRWGKLVFAVLLFAQGLGRLGTADCLARRDLEPLWSALVGEVALAALAAGVRPRPVHGFDPLVMMPGAPAGPALDGVASLVAYARSSAKTHSGIWRDLWVRRRPTEVDALIGPVIDIANRHGTPSTYLQRLVELIHEAEQGILPQSDDNLLELLES